MAVKHAAGISGTLLRWNEGPNGNWANLLRVLAQIALLQGVRHCEYTKNTTKVVQESDRTPVAARLLLSQLQHTQEAHLSQPC